MTLKSLFSAICLAVFAATASYGQLANVSQCLKIAQVGDSVGASFTNRQTIETVLDGEDFWHEFVGDNTYNATGPDYPTNAWGGARYSIMKVGRTLDRGSGPVFEPGFQNAVNNYNPDVILFVGGNNDTLRPNWQAELDAFLKYLASTGLPVIMTNIYQHNINAPDWNRPNASAAQIPTMNAHISATAAANSGWLTLIDLNAAINTTLIRDDGVHLTTAGQQVLGNLLAAEILLLPVDLVGDVNQDGVIDFKDLSPFIYTLQAGAFKAEADVNQDGVVDFADVPPFIAMLIAQ